MRFERADCRLSAVRLAWCPETYSLFAAGHMARGDFRAPLEMTRGAENSDNQMSDLCCFAACSSDINHSIRQLIDRAGVWWENQKEKRPHHLLRKIKNEDDYCI